MPEFFDGAPTMRGLFESRFGPPYPDTWERAAWEYVSSDLYRYFRTHPQAVFPEDLYSRFLAQLGRWGAENLGCPSPSPNSLNCHVDGCWHGLHADIYHYDWAFVFSLTDWNARSFSGGETLMLTQRVLDYWHDFAYDQPMHEDSLLEATTPNFNQLMVFDARIPHGVRTVHGSRDLLKGRLTLIGHFGVPGLVTSEAIEEAEHVSNLEAALAELKSRLSSVRGVAGAVVPRIEFAANGSVRSVTLLASSLRSTGDDLSAPREATERIAEFLTDLRFPAMPEAAWANLPVRLPVAAKEPTD